MTVIINLVVGITASLLVTFLLSIGFYCLLSRRKTRHFRRQCPIVCFSCTSVLSSLITRPFNAVLSALGLMSIRLSLLTLFLFGISIMTYSFSVETLTILNDSWTVAAYPFIMGVLKPALLTLRLLYTAIVPLYNLFVALWFQLIQGTPILIANCEIDGLYLPLRSAANSTIYSGDAVVQFFKDPSQDFNGTLAIQHGLRAIAELQLGLACVCHDLTPFFEIFFHGFREIQFAKAINHAVNVPVSFIREISDALQYPNPTPLTLNRTFHHVYGFTVDTAIGLDRWLLHALTVGKIVPESRLPEEFLFSGAARGVVGTFSIRK